MKPVSVLFWTSVLLGMLVVLPMIIVAGLIKMIMDLLTGEESEY